MERWWHNRCAPPHSPTRPVDPLLPSSSFDGPEPRDKRLGQVVDGRYRLDALLSSGSMGRVYRAQQLNLDRTVAVKIMDLDPTLIRTPEVASYEKRFLNEAAALARLQHPNTVRIFDFGVGDGMPYIVMEYIQGRSLREVIQRSAPMQLAHVVELADGICRSLAEAHAAGIVHRDLKPGNILITTDVDGTERVKVLDFGLVKMMDGDDITQMGQILGSPNYMAPEIIQEEADIDGRADIYALGVVLFRMLTGKLPYGRARPATVLVAHLRSPVPRLQDVWRDADLPEVVEWTVARCLAKDRDQRMASAAMLRKSLQACLRASQRTGAWSLGLGVVDGKLVGPPLLMDNAADSGPSMLVAPPKRIEIVNAAPAPAPNGPTERVGPSWRMVAAVALVLVVVLSAWTAMQSRSEPVAVAAVVEPVQEPAAEAVGEAEPEPEAPEVVPEAPEVVAPTPVKKKRRRAALAKKVEQKQEPAPAPEPVPAPAPEPAPEPVEPPSAPSDDVWLDDDLKDPFE